MERVEPISFLRPEAAASRAGWSMATLWRRARAGVIHVYRRDGRAVFRADEIDRALEARAA